VREKAAKVEVAGLVLCDVNAGSPPIPRSRDAHGGATNALGSLAAPEAVSVRRASARVKEETPGHHPRGRIAALVAANGTQLR